MRNFEPQDTARASRSQFLGLSYLFKMPSIIVIGASGYVGAAVVKAAASIPGAIVTAVVRDPAAAKSKALVTSENIKLVAGTMEDGSSRKCLDPGNTAA